MKRITHALIVLLISIAFISCQKDFLEKKPLAQYSDAVVWTDVSLVEVFVNRGYEQLPQEVNGRMMMTSLTDESMFNSGSGSETATKSLVTPSDYAIWDAMVVQQRYRWENIYVRVRALNLALEQVEKNTYSAANSATISRLKGEMLFLRAFNYHMLLFMYGGVPIVTKTYNLTDDFLMARNTFDECVKFIVDDCDKAAALLPIAHTAANYGRATKGAALALKSRVLLFAASDLPNNNGSWTNGYANPELIGYVDGDRTTRWNAAKDAAKAVIDLQAYDLYKKNPAVGDNIAQNLAEIFITASNVEDIFVRQFDETTAGTTGIAFTNSPGGYGGWGNTNPLNNIVDAYEMSDGSKFSWNNPAQAGIPYKNREPRFYAHINFEGAPWRIRPDNGKALDPVGVIQVGFYQQANGSFISGLDTRSSPTAAFAGTYTGYFMRKFINPTVVIPYQTQTYPQRFIRYDEVLLNYAEACAEVNLEDEARTYIGIIRIRAGLPNISTTGAELKASIKHERRIELAFEMGIRYWDIRRWMTAPQVMTNGEGIEPRKFLGQDNLTYTKIVSQIRAWKNQSYYMPIKLTEMNKNKLLIQNPLY